MPHLTVKYGDRMIWDDESSGIVLNILSGKGAGTKSRVFIEAPLYFIIFLVTELYFKGISKVFGGRLPGFVGGHRTDGQH